MTTRPRTKKSKKMALSNQHRLVGQFIFGWNLLEDSLNTAITEMCKLDRLHGIIITANLNFQTKMNIITTMIDLLGLGKSKEWHEIAQNVTAEIHTINNQWRTLVVHNLIRPVDTKTVKFLKVSAKRKLQWPDTTKTKMEFLHIFDRMLYLDDEIERIAKELSTAPISGLAKALAGSSSGGPYWQGLLGPLLHQTGDTPSSPPQTASLGILLEKLENPPPKAKR